jgi:hypothetical protein
VIERRAFSVLERKQLYVVGCMTGGARSARLNRMNRLDVLMSILHALVSHHDCSAEVARRARELTEVGSA